jgi:hypothetical protein
MDSGHKAQSSSSLAIDWKRLGFKKQHARTGAIWNGLTLKTLIP